MAARDRMPLPLPLAGLLACALLACAAPALVRAAEPQPSSHAQPAAASGAPQVVPTGREGLAVVSQRDLAPGLHELVFADGSVYRGTLRGRTFQGHGGLVTARFRS